MISVIGEEEIAPYLYPKLMVDKKGDVWLMRNKDEGLLIKNGNRDGNHGVVEYAEFFGPLKDFHGSVTLSNS